MKLNAEYATDNAEKYEYELLVGHNRTDGSFKTNEQLRMEYLSLTDELIHKVTSGVEFPDPKTGEKVRQPVDTILFLDKSARPVAWLMREAWPLLASEENAETPPMPEMKFLNIDREQWIDQLDPNRTGALDSERLPDEAIQSLRSVFIAPNYKQDGLSDELFEKPTYLDGKNVLIVDEVLSTGRTLRMAELFLKKAYPEARFAGTHWMGGVTARNGGASTGNADLPVWYSDKTSLGRGVGNRELSPDTSAPGNVTQRLGAWFLSCRFLEQDERSLQLRTELNQLPHDPNVMRRPSRHRDDIIERTERLNGMPFGDAQREIFQVVEEGTRK